MPLTWPIGMGKRFKGVYNLEEQQLGIFTAGYTPKNDDGVLIEDLDDPVLDEMIGQSPADQLREDVELISVASEPFDLDLYLNGTQTPVFFGSAINNFGVREMLDAFVRIAPSPASDPQRPGRWILVKKRFQGSPLKFRPIWTLSTGTELLFSGSVPENSPRE